MIMDWLDITTAVLVAVVVIAALLYPLNRDDDE
jgi:hypothetical protein